MTLSAQYSKNRPLFYSILTGIIYFLLYWSLDFGSASIGSLLAVMFFLPGLSFPLATSYYHSGKIKNPILKNGIHFVLSFGIYIVIFFLFYLDYMGGGTQKYLMLFYGFFGSLFFQLLTKHLLKKEITISQIAVTSFLSGLALLPFILIGKNGIEIGLAVFLWTMINGKLLNDEYQRASYHLHHNKLKNQNLQS